MTQRVLEIGAGRYPAVLNPGTLLQDTQTQYAALDTAYHEGAPFNYLTTDAAATGLPGQSFDHVIYRSVFGAYTLARSAVGALVSSESGWEGSSWQNTLESLQESFRLLKPGGRLCIAEEDTPCDRTTLITEITKAGFAGVHVHPSRLQEEPEDGQALTGSPRWLQERGKYWGNHVSADGSVPAFIGSFDEEPPYVVTACRPSERLAWFQQKHPGIVKTGSFILRHTPVFN